ncbi:hypothetical protein [Methanocaldococcus sp.]|uniref:hypothetical protein n=1 Tax=Methanocaldococcus sp. TaxID=2152917 RepID=UPI00260532F5|nr:hypothetical protein [Methanocaldococcus sp.]MCQ6254873.1 hypothetical protein [Methanocaldococcus sp.]
MKNIKIHFLIVQNGDITFKYKDSINKNNISLTLLIGFKNNTNKGDIKTLIKKKKIESKIKFFDFVNKASK